jgi:N-acetylglucosamine kinase-like BadF-type ATPase
MFTKKLPCRMVKELSLYMAVYAAYKRNIIVQSSLRFISSMGNAVRIPHDGRCALSAQVQRRAGIV